jgi:3-isopropylmalate/(R)-2-methylmalate dehydratase small subunit
MEPLRVVESRTVVLPRDHIDTDQVIPARFLTVTDKAGLGAALFADWRYEPDGTPTPGFALNDPAAAGARILVAGDNFGCGSSREHAAWALHDYGFRVVISTSIADIFRNNALKNGILPVVVPADVHARLRATPGAVVRVDLEACTITLPDGGTAPFAVDAFARHCLLDGVDELGFLLAHDAAIRAFEEAR